MHRDIDSIRPYPHLNLPPPPVPIHSIRPSVVLPGHFNMVPPPPVVPTSTTSSSALSSSLPSSVNETMSIFHKERLHDVLQNGLGSYVFIDHFGLVPKLNHF